MNETAPASHQPVHARGVLEAATPGPDGTHRIVLSFPGTSYQIHLETLRALDTPLGKRAVGTIRVQARRVDVVDTGGRYVEPVYGRPRRVQGRVVSLDHAANAIVVDAGVPIELKLGKLQSASDFREDDLVSCDVLPGASFAAAV